MVRVADALDMAQGRTRMPIEAGQEGIHSISAAAVDEVRIEAGEERPVRIEIELNNSAGIFQVDDLLATKIRDTPLEGQVEVVAKIEGETEKRLLDRLPAGLTAVSRGARGRCVRAFLALLEAPWISDRTIDRSGEEGDHAEAEEGHRLVGGRPGQADAVLGQRQRRGEQRARAGPRRARETIRRRDGRLHARESSAPRRDAPPSCTHCHRMRRHDVDPRSHASWVSSRG